MAENNLTNEDIFAWCARLGAQVRADKAAARKAARLSTPELIEAVKSHALAHYTDGGWDVVVECYSDDEVAEVIGKATTVAGALRKFAPLVDVWSDRQADARNSAF